MPAFTFVNCIFFQTQKTQVDKPNLWGSWDCSYRYPGLFYWAALQSLSLSEEDQSLALQLHRPKGEAGEDVRAVLEALGMDEGLEAMMEDLLQIWIFNSLRYWDWWMTFCHFFCCLSLFVDLFYLIWFSLSLTLGQEVMINWSFHS